MSVTGAPRIFLCRAPVAAAAVLLEGVELLEGAVVVAVSPFVLEVAAAAAADVDLVDVVDVVNVDGGAVDHRRRIRHRDCDCRRVAVGRRSGTPLRREIGTSFETVFELEDPSTIFT